MCSVDHNEKVALLLPVKQVVRSGGKNTCVGDSKAALCSVLCFILTCS